MPTATPTEDTSPCTLSTEIKTEKITKDTQSPTSDHVKDADSDSDLSSSADDFDWDEDDGASKEEEDHADKINFKAHRGRAVWLLFMKLARPVRALLVGVLGVGILITPLLVVQLKFRSSPARLTVHVWSLWCSIIWAAGCATYLVVDAVPRLVIGVIVLFGGHVERLRIQIELIMAVAPWLKLALDITWAWIALSVLRPVYNPPGSYWVIINRAMQALFAAGLMILAEKLFLHYVAINFHQKALADRLAENKLGLKALDHLSNAQVTVNRKSPYNRPGHKTSPFGSLGAALNVSSMQDQPSPMLEKNETLAEGRKSGRGGRKQKKHKAMASVIVDQLGDVIGQVALKNSKLHSETTGVHSARQLAKKLFSALADENRSCIIVEDFFPYFRSTAEAHTAFALFDKDGNGDLTKREMAQAVQRIYRERKALVASLKDVSSAVAKLDAVLLGLVLIVMIFVCLLIFNPHDTITSLVPLATIILGFSFIFGHSAQLLFESLIFIFATHVFDVGDLVMIDDQPLMVREFGLFSTTFRRLDGQEIIAPNALLSSAKLVHNLRRSSSMAETTELVVSYNTPLEIIEQLRQRIDAYMQANSREWSSSAVNIDSMEYQNSIHLIIAMEHRANWQDWGGRWARRNAFMRHLKTILEELDIKYTKPVQPVMLPKDFRGFDANSARSQGLQPPRGRHGVEKEYFGNAGTFNGSRSLRLSGSRSLRSGGDVF